MNAETAACPKRQAAFIFSTNKMRSAIADERKTDEKDLF
jgi:hypothetical protein